MKALEIKNWTASRYANLRACDQAYYKFSADWAQPQTKAVCNTAIKTLTKRVADVEAAYDNGGWGSKADTEELIASLKALLKSAKLGSDDQQNAFTAYQLERYFLRLWYRGTKEQRDALKPAAPKAEAKPKTKAKTKAKVSVKAKATTKKAAPKSAPETADGKVILHEVEVDDPQSVGIIDYLSSFLQDELTADQKRTLAAGLVAALK